MFGHHSGGHHILGGLFQHNQQQQQPAQPQQSYNQGNSNNQGGLQVPGQFPEGQDPGGLVFFLAKKRGGMCLIVIEKRPILRAGLPAWPVDG
jgi:hypothetical protein